MKTAEQIAEQLIGTDAKLFDVVTDEEANDFELVCELDKLVYYSIASNKWEKRNQYSVLIACISRFNKLSN